MRLTPLRNLILTNWREYHPTMYAQFQAQNRLEQELETTEKAMSDLLHQLVVIQKMDYQAAMELVREQFLLPEEDSSTNPHP
jgi:hypothetical protein